jgi:ribonuclease P protein component
MNTFRREERLKSEKIITQLFREGHSFSCYPLRLVYSEFKNPLITEGVSFPIQVSFSVPKKSFKSAVVRNRLRRRMREAYRIHKIELYNYLNTNILYLNKKFAFMLLYTSKEELPYADIEKGILKMILKFKSDTLNNSDSEKDV